MRRSPISGNPHRVFASHFDGSPTAVVQERLNVIHEDIQRRWTTERIDGIRGAMTLGRVIQVLSVVDADPDQAGAEFPREYLAFCEKFRSVLEPLSDGKISSRSSKFVAHAPEPDHAAARSDNGGAGAETMRGERPMARVDFVEVEPVGNYKAWSPDMIKTFLRNVDRGLASPEKRPIGQTCAEYGVPRRVCDTWRKSDRAIGAETAKGKPGAEATIVPASITSASPPSREEAKQAEAFAWPALPAYADGWGTAEKQQFLQVVAAYGKRGGTSEGARHYGVPVGTAATWRSRMVKASPPSLQSSAEEPAAAAPTPGTRLVDEGGIVVLPKEGRDPLSDLEFHLNGIREIRGEMSDPDLAVFVEALEEFIAAKRAERSAPAAVRQDVPSSPVEAPAPVPVPMQSSAVVAAPAPSPSDDFPELKRRELFIRWFAAITGAKPVDDYAEVAARAEKHFSFVITNVLKPHGRMPDQIFAALKAKGAEGLRKAIACFNPNHDGAFAHNHAPAFVREALSYASEHHDATQTTRDVAQVDRTAFLEEKERRRRCVAWGKQSEVTVYDYASFVGWMHRTEMRWVYDLSRSLHREARSGSAATERQLSNVGYEMLRMAVSTFDPDLCGIDAWRTDLENQMTEAMQKSIACPEQLSSDRLDPVQRAKVSPQTYVAAGMRQWLGTIKQEPDPTRCDRFRAWAAERGFSGGSHNALVSAVAVQKAPECIRMVERMALPAGMEAVRRNLLDAARFALVTAVWNYDPSSGEDLDAALARQLQSSYERVMERAREKADQ